MSPAARERARLVDTARRAVAAARSAANDARDKTAYAAAMLRAAGCDVHAATCWRKADDLQSAAVALDVIVVPS